MREHLQSAVEELQASNEELMSLNEEHQSANEEFQSANEELQSTNEELETSREELQSVNEELVTVNAELQAKIEQLVVMQNDLKNLMENTKIGMIFLDDRLAIKRFTAQATRVFRLVESDVGRPLADIKSNSIGGEDLVDGARAVLDSLVPREIEMMTTDGDWLLARTMPYRTVDNVIEGVVLTFTDITKLKMIEESLTAAREYAESIVDTVRSPLSCWTPVSGSYRPAGPSTAPSTTLPMKRSAAPCMTWAAASGTFRGSGICSRRYFPATRNSRITP